MFFGFGYMYFRLLFLYFECLTLILLCHLVFISFVIFGHIDFSHFQSSSHWFCHILPFTTDGSYKSSGVLIKMWVLVFSHFLTSFQGSPWLVFVFYLMSHTFHSIFLELNWISRWRYNFEFVDSFTKLFLIIFFGFVSVFKHIPNK